MVSEEVCVHTAAVGPRLYTAFPPAPSLEAIVEGDAAHFSFDAVVQAEPDPLPPPPKLQRPVLFVHGYNSGDHVWNNMNWYFLDGGNAMGGTVHATEPSYLDPCGKIFNMRFSKPWQSAAKNEAELENALEQIANVTGYPKVDVVAHSMGALNTRLYIDQGGQRVGKLVMIAPPNHGSIQADTELWMRENLGIPVFPPNADPDVLEALKDLRADLPPDEPGGPPGNPFLNDLNTRWNAQRDATEGAAILVGGGVPTVNTDGSVTPFGDGFVTWESSSMPGIPLQMYTDPLRNTHGKLLRDPGVIADVGKFLAGR
jgi:pimeloyl-ACP methyl ester carboxylesterase